MMSRWSAEAVAAGAEEVEEVVVAEDLELLADFVADVAIGGVQIAELFGKRIYLWQREFFLSQRAQDIQDIKRPPARSNAQARESP